MLLNEGLIDMPCTVAIIYSDTSAWDHILFIYGFRLHPILSPFLQIKAYGLLL